MPETINLVPEGDTILLRPAGFLGAARFPAYLAASRAGGARYDARARAQRAPRSAIGRLTDALAAAGFRAATTAPELAREAAPTTADAIDLPEGLYPYQVAGARKLAAAGRGALLADPMGLGKTAQALAALPRNARAVVVCPAAVKGVWGAETARWRPDLRTSVLAGRGSFRWPAAGEIVITNYDILPEANQLGPGRFESTAPPAPAGVVMIADEAHALKSSRAKRTGAWRGLVSSALAADGRAWLITGTPLLGRPPELWAVLQAARLATTVFGSWQRFCEAFGATPGRWGGLAWGHPAPWVAAALGAVMIRRRKEDVLPDLPPKRHRYLEVDIADDAAATLTQADEILDSTGTHLEDILAGVAGGSVAFASISRAMAASAAAKIPALVQLVEAYEDAEEPVVVFSRHRAPVDHLAAREGWAAITGDTPADQRTAIVSAFQGGSLRGVAATIQAGGVGITLTRAANAIFVDRSWTPAENEQAEDRICRIGQDRGCLITILVAAHKLERRVAEILKAKTATIAASTGAVATPAAPTAGVAIDAAPTERDAPQIDAATLGRIPDGNYALERDGKISFYVVARGARGKWAGFLFLRRQDGPNLTRLATVTPAGAVRGSGRLILEEIAADARAAAIRYGKEIGRCALCGLPLTNEDSRERGIGPICAAKHGW